MNYRRILSPLMVAFNEDIKMNNGPSHITDLIILTIKSLIPSQDYVEVDIDYNRYGEEIKLWKYYRHGVNTSLMNILDYLEPEIYWNHIDDTIYFRIIPIVLTNRDYLAIKKEVIKNVLFTTGNIETLIEAILLAKLLYLLILEEENIVEKLKEEIINFSQVEFMKSHSKDFRLSIEKYKGNFKVLFEQKKIYALNTLNLSFSHKFKALKDSMDVLLNDKPGITSIGKCISACIKSEFNQEIYLDDYYNELCIYLYRLRKGRINPEVLKIEKYYLPDIFQFNEGDVFYHSLLNKSKVIKKEIVDNKIHICVSTKSGIYKFIE
jgi:hypothetical protein